MNKKLLILPLAAVLAGGLSSCDFSVITNFFKKEKKEEPITLESIPGPMEFEGHKRIAKPENGKRYRFGYYDSEYSEMRFITGKQHTDAKGEYPYYMATTENTIQGSAEVEVNYINSTQFTMKVICEDTESLYHNKYMSIYAAESAYGNNVYSLAPTDDVDGTYLTSEEVTVSCNSKFEYLESFADTAFFSPVIYEQDTRLEETEPTPRFFGCSVYNGGTRYVSMDCSSADKAISEDYCIAHFYELID